MASPVHKSIFCSVVALVFATPLLAPRSALGQEQFSPLGVRSMALDDGWLKMKDGFGAEFFMTDQLPSESWIPERIRQTAHLLVTKRYKPVRTVIFIVNPASRHTLNSGGKEVVVADVTYDVAVTKPDGSSYYASKGALGWTGEPPSPHLIRVTQSTVTITFETMDPAGIYSVDIVVHDKIRKVDIPLQHTITLAE